ncbi:hypothetical protein KKG31_00945 [Patescibacteria group bacterium]|nr:hypothetical protein [Patescibacteria group bacterium]MBU1757747.1 hypothetical protein [Patescibacteria group bacterium]
MGLINNSSILAQWDIVPDYTLVINESLIENLEPRNSSIDGVYQEISTNN